jgi:hypothetical protein
MDLAEGFCYDIVLFLAAEFSYSFLTIKYCGL